MAEFLIELWKKGFWKNKTNCRRVEGKRSKDTILCHCNRKRLL